METRERIAQRAAQIHRTEATREAIPIHRKHVTRCWNPAGVILKNNLLKFLGCPHGNLHCRANMGMVQARWWLRGEQQFSTNAVRVSEFTFSALRASRRTRNHPSWP